MPIKQIQLRGISRTPSDRTVEDGGCAESLNVQIENNELAPVIAAKNVTQTIGLASDDFDADRQVIYIHKLTAYENFLALMPATNSLQFFVQGTGWEQASSAMEEGEKVTSVTAIGKTVIVVTDMNTRYFLFKNGAYVSLGTEIPKPVCEFKVYEGNVYFEQIRVSDVMTGDAATLMTWNNADAYNAAFTKYGTTLGHSHGGTTVTNVTAAFNEAAASIWAIINNWVIRDRANGIFDRPVFARYALRLYDGSYIYHSVPLMLGIGLSEEAVEVHTFNSSGEVRINMVLDNRFTAKVTCSTINELSDWADIVSSVDIFLSTDIATVKNGSVLSSAALQTNGWLKFGYKDKTKPEEELTSKGNFYLVRTVQPGHSITDEPLVPMSQDLLVTQPALSFDFRSGHRPRALTGALAYNNRLVGFGVRETLTNGHPFLQSTIYSEASSPDPITDTRPHYYFKFYIRLENGEEKCVIPVWARNGQQRFEGKYMTTGQSGIKITTINTFGLLMYPDSRCFKAEVQIDNVLYSIAMKEHPNLDCAYFFVDMTRSLAQALSSAGRIIPGTMDLTEDKEIEEDNKLIMSDVDNPFVVPANGWQTFDERVFAAATTTRPLSTGQFGQFPLYVFTDGGINAIAINNDGTFGSHSPVSREVALEGTVTPIEQEIIFATSKGIMTMSGADIDNITPFMRGEHYYLDNADARALIAASQDWSGLIGAITDTDPFMTFAASSRIVYDYTGGRIILLNPTKTYAYAYKIESRTWHKLSLDTDVKFSRLLNSYPQALVTMEKEDYGYAVYDFTTNLDDKVITQSTTNKTKAIIITRSLDFGQTDIRKALKSLRIRGHYNTGDVKYLLLASMDGINWGLVSTLRGGSYKLFRMIVLADLAPTERIAWIDVDYEPRFTNKLR